MPVIDLSQFTSVEELQKLSVEITEEIARRQDVEREQLLLKIEQAAKRYGVDVNQFLGRVGKHTKTKGGYQNPDNPKQRWSGRGKKPGWLQEKIDGGMSIDMFKVS